MDFVDIMDSINVTSDEYLSVADRYYTVKYCTDYSTEENNLDHCISFHTNRICLISLAEKHPIIKDRKQILKIDSVVGNIDRLENKSSGKAKHGAQKLNPNSILCYIHCSDGSSYPVYSCIKGKLLEINKNIFKNPQLIIEKPRSQGYIALILPYLDSFTQIKDSMMSNESYCK
ncbi:protein Simiate [Agrilus planipennis]|uniref:Protein Abitram n=1 Tax=Agrilus planipennis TaxID=224129 RepID=A0A7F5R5V7_AGRPL|nr:protein Simiate [Agrilus planipennis]